MGESFSVTEPKTTWEKYYIDIDISTWLDEETISDVTFKAYDEDGVDVSTTILDSNKCTYSGSIVRIYVQNGTDGEGYYVICKVQSSGNNYKEYMVFFKVQDLI